MIPPMQFTPGKKYALDGATLQQLWDAVATSQILPSDEYELDVTPKKGTRLKDIKIDITRRWDLVPAADGKHTLHDPAIYAAYGSATAIEITNNPVTLAAGKWVVAQIDDLAANPWTLTISMADEEDGGDLEVYTFDGDAELAGVKLPLWHIIDEASPGAKKIGALYGVKFVSDSILTLASHHVVVPDRAISRDAPRLIPL